MTSAFLVTKDDPVHLRRVDFPNEIVRDTVMINSTASWVIDEGGLSIEAYRENSTLIWREGM